MITINTTNSVLRYTTLPYDIVVDGYSYSSNQAVASSDTPKIAVSTDKTSYKIVFADSSYSFATIGNELINARLHIRAGFNNTTNATIDGFAPGFPILSSEHFVSVYGGFIEKTFYSINQEDGVLFSIECASPMANLDAVNAFYTTKDALRQLVGIGGVGSYDTSFDQVTLSGVKRSLSWGKI